MKKLMFLTICIVTSLPVAASDIMKGLFEDNLRINATSPGSANTGSTYGFALGGASVRIRHMNANLVTFTPPSLSAGCSGIDFFAGSFSVVSKDEVIQMGRAIMQGAGTYAFGLALDSICPSCNDEMQKIQKYMRKVNDMMKNTCEMSEKALHSAPFGIGDWANETKTKNAEVALTMKNENSSVDTFAGFLGLADEGVNENSSQAEKDLVSNNWLTDSLKKFNNNWLSAYGLTEEQGKGFVLAIMGSAINRIDGVGDSTTASGGRVPLPALFGMQEFIEGKLDSSKLEIYECKAYKTFTEAQCLDVAVINTDMVSLQAFYFKKIAGTATGNYMDGLAYKFYSYQQGVTATNVPTAEEFAFMKTFELDALEMFEIMGDNSTMVISISDWLARTQSIKLGYALLSRLRTEFMKLTMADYSDDKGLAAKVRKLVPERLNELKNEIRTLNEIESANKESLSVVVAQYQQMRLKIIRRNAKMMSQG